MPVVVLGNRLESTEIHPTLQGRMDVALDLFAEVDSDYLVVSGGQSNEDVPLSEAEVMQRYAVEQGVDSDAIRLDESAMDTVGNGYFTRLIVDELDDGDTVYVVSSCYHMDRAEFIFEQCYGDEYTIDTSHCYETNIPASDLNEEDSLNQAKRFFEPLEPGDTAAIRQRMIDDHYYYDWLAE